MIDPMLVVVWEAGVAAGLDDKPGESPDYIDRNHRIMWGKAWIVGRHLARLNTVSEHDHQVALFRWAEFAQLMRPELKLMYAIPNGGLRAKAVAGKLKAEGVKAGVPDVCLPVPRGAHGALYIEMKADKGRPSALQQEWLTDLKAQGNQAVLAYGWRNAQKAIVAHLDQST